ncbi:MAG: hypothetical protein AAGB16_02510 [Pseudomonadota bacterium]
MDKKEIHARFQWTPQIDRQARLLSALGTSHAQIALILVCDRATVRKYLGKQGELAPLSLAEMSDLFERYDTERNIAEAVGARSGSAEQARLRSSFRARMNAQKTKPEEPTKPSVEELSDEQLCADLERLVGREFTITD